MGATGGGPMYATDSDEQLIARSLRSDRGAFAELFARHSKPVYLYAWGVTRHNGDAEDITQEVFVTAWAKLAQIRIAGSSALPWLLVTCRNLLLNHSRRQSYRATTELDEMAIDHRTSTRAADAAARSEELRLVMHEIGQLDGTDQRICQLCLVEGYSYAEAASKLGITSSAIAKRVERLRIALKAAVRNDS